MADKANSIDSSSQWSFVEFDSPVTDLVKFGQALLCRLENGDVYMSIDGNRWEQFLFSPTGQVIEVEKPSFAQREAAYRKRYGNLPAQPETLIRDKDDWGF